MSKKRHKKIIQKYIEREPKSLEEFKNILKKHSNGGRYVFRGHANKSYYLLPNAWRYKESDESKVMNYNYISYEKELVVKLRDILSESLYNENCFHGNIESDYDILSYAQHYEFKTRLLDWTYCYDIAMSFACGTDNENSLNGAVWILKISSNPRRGSCKEYDKNIILEQQSPTNQNQLNQKGLFVRNVIRKNHRRFLRYETIQGQKKFLKKVILNSSFKSELKKELESKFGIKSTTLLSSPRKAVKIRLDQLKIELYGKYNIKES